MSTTDALDIEFDDLFVRELPELALSFVGDEVVAADMVVLDRELAAEIGLDADALASTDGAAMLAGSWSPASAPSVAMAYAGHQFGGYSPRLGDGRAILLGELIDGDGNRVDLHLKGSGRTPFSRGGDGKATIGPMLREYVFAQAMHRLGIPTTRALAVVTTGEMVQREQLEPGAVLARTASSHLRVGTFEYAVRLEDKTVLRRLADHAIDRHYPELRDTDEPYVGLLAAVVDAQASLVAKWMLVGFIHGVMNTDNVTISGETIDYGPCAFMDRFDPATVFSSIDHGGRYAYGNQPSITGWNLTRFAETLVPLIGDDFDEAVEAVKAVLETFPAKFQEYWLAGMRAKLGLGVATDGDESLFDDWLSLLHTDGVDYTSAFRALSASLRGSDAALTALFANSDGLAAWIVRWESALETESADELDAVADAMDSVNPVYVARNHIVDAALAAAELGDYTPFHELVDVLAEPFTERDGLADYARPADDDFNNRFRTFCGT